MDPSRTDSTSDKYSYTLSPLRRLAVFTNTSRTIPSNAHAVKYMSPLQIPAGTLPHNTKPQVSDPPPSPNPRQPDKLRSDTLACLDRAYPADGFNTPRVLSDDTHRQLFDAWPVAATDVLAKWNHLADKANLEPRLPPALTRAADIVSDHAPDRLTQEEIDRL